MWANVDRGSAMLNGWTAQSQFERLHWMVYIIWDLQMLNTDSTDVDRRTLSVNGWTPLAEPHKCHNLLQISPRGNSQFQMRKVWWNTGTYFTYSTYSTYLAAKFPASQDIRLSIRCLRSPHISLNIDYSNTIQRMVRSPHISPVAAPV